VRIEGAKGKDESPTNFGGKTPRQNDFLEFPDRKGSVRKGQKKLVNAKKESDHRIGPPKVRKMGS